ncbi:MAG: peptidyl-prolyl cis-trans isomerase [candidate division KSB1 bacterium]|nr:peptidyl-prolyl cis-trans isomerase [candidate division KSB1 bacterium]
MSGSGLNKGKVFFVLMVSLLVACKSSNRSIPKEKQPIVTIEDGQLTLDDLLGAIPISMQSRVSIEQVNNYIQQWMEMELIYREALRIGLDKDEAFLAELEKSKRNLLVQFYMDRYLAENEKPSDEEAISYYNENKESYRLETDEVRALHILVQSQEEADKAYQRISGGESFEIVARQVSIDYVENQRIDLGYFTRDEILPELAAVVFEAKAGTVTRPIKSSLGYHIFKIVDRKSRGSYREFDAVKDQISARLSFIRRNERYRDLIIGLRNKTNYKFYIEPLREFFKDSTFQLSNEIVNPTR